jgi:hypothetical protein
MKVHHQHQTVTYRPIAVSSLESYSIVFETYSGNQRHDTEDLVSSVMLPSRFPPRRPGFKPGSSHVGFVVDKVALGQVFS